jgi:DNA-binding MarR family transcriptional regulator
MARKVDKIERSVTTDEVAGLLLRWLSASMRRSGCAGVSASHRLASERGATLPMMVALHVLAFEGPQTMTMLAERLTLSASATSHLLQRLVELALARREDDPGDRRQRLLAITAEGRRAVDELMQARLTELSAGVAPLSERTRFRLGRVLRDVVRELAEVGDVCATPADSALRDEARATGLSPLASNAGRRIRGAVAARSGRAAATTGRRPPVRNKTVKKENG